MTRRHALNVLVTAGLVLGLSACGGASTEAGGPSATDSAAAVTVQKARAAAASASSVKINGTAERGGRTYTYVLAVANGKGERDAVTVGSGSLRYLKLGPDAYIRVSGETLNSELGGAAAGLAEGLRERWLAVDPAALPGMAGSFQDVLGFLGKYPSTDAVLAQTVPAGATFTGKGAETIKGVPVTRVDFDAPLPPDVAADLTGQGLNAPARLTGSVWVASSGTPYPVAVRTNAGTDVTLSGWDRPVDLTRPAKRRQVTLDQLLGGSGLAG